MLKTQEHKKNIGAQKNTGQKKDRKKKNEKKKFSRRRSFFRFIFTHKTHFLVRATHTRETLFIDIISSKRARARNVRNKNTFNNNHGDHVREIVPASLFEERDAHFDGAREFLYLYFLAFSSEVNVALSRRITRRQIERRRR